jgi:hypothetical protein
VPDGGAAGVLVVVVAIAAGVVVMAVGVLVAGADVVRFATNGLEDDVETTVGTVVEWENAAAVGPDVVVDALSLSGFGRRGPLGVPPVRAAVAAISAISANDTARTTHQVGRPRAGPERIEDTFSLPGTTTERR